MKNFWIDIEKYTKVSISTYFILKWSQIVLKAMGYNGLTLKL